MAKRGRPPKLDEAKRNEIITVLRLGGTIAVAAQFVGCCSRTIYNTADRDPEFGKRMQRARASHEITLLKRIDDAASDPKYWRAAAWQLEHMYPDRYQKRAANSLPIPLFHEFMHDLVGMFMKAIPESDVRTSLAKQAKQKYDHFTAEHDGAVEAALEITADEQELMATAAA